MRNTRVAVPGSMIRPEVAEGKCRSVVYEVWRKTSLAERVVDFDGAILAVLIVDAPLHPVYSLAVQLLFCFLEVDDNLRDVLRVVASDF
jgi:hypothetical protein